MSVIEALTYVTQSNWQMAFGFFAGSSGSNILIWLMTADCVVEVK